MINLLLVPGEAREGFLRIEFAAHVRPQEQRVIIGPRDEELGLRRREGLVSLQSALLCVCVVCRQFARMVERPCTQDEVRVESKRVDPVRVLRQVPDDLARLAVP